MSLGLAPTALTGRSLRRLWPQLLLRSVSEIGPRADLRAASRSERRPDLQRSEHTLCKARGLVTDSVVLGALDPDHLYSPLRRRTGRCTRGFLARLAVLEKLPHRPAAGIYPTRHRRVCLRRCRCAEVSFRCGPLAIHRVMLAVHPDNPHTELITGSRSTPRGCSLNQVEELSQQPCLHYHAKHVRHSGCWTPVGGSSIGRGPE